jgi:hypothetical protein
MPFQILCLKLYLQNYYQFICEMDRLFGEAVTVYIEMYIGNQFYFIPMYKAM